MAQEPPPAVVFKQATWLDISQEFSLVCQTKYVVKVGGNDIAGYHMFGILDGCILGGCLHISEHLKANTMGLSQPIAPH